MAFPANTTLIDDFNRADAPLVGFGNSATTSSGEIWAGPTDITSLTGLIIANNQAESPGPGYGSAYLTNMYGPDVDIFVTLTDIDTLGGTGLVLFSLYARLKNPEVSTATCYLLEIHEGTQDHIISRVHPDGSQNPLAYITNTPVSVGDKIGFRVQGIGAPELSMWYQASGSGVWAQAGSTFIDDFTTTPPQDSSVYQSSGFIGLEVNTTAPAVDDYGGGTVATFPTNNTTIDNFNRADNTSLAGATASSGYLWANSMVQGPSTTQLGIASSQLYLAASNNNGYIDAEFGPDSEVYVDVPVVPGNGDYIALYARLTNPGSGGGNDQYGLIYVHATSGSAQWILRRYDNNAQTNLVTLVEPAITSGDGIGFSVIGTGSAVTLRAYRKVSGIWSLVGMTNDTSGSRILTAGFLGVDISGGLVRLDNLSGGTAKPFPVITAIIDNFNRGNVDGIGGSVTSSGAVWGPTMIQNSSSAGLQIDTFKLRRSGGFDNAYINVLFGPDCELYVDVPVMFGWGKYIALFSRIQLPGSASFSCYGLVCINGATPYMTLRRYQSGSFTQVGGTSFDLDQLNDGDSIGFRVTGTGTVVLLEAFQKTAGAWRQVVSVGDASGSRITSAGYLGLEIDSSDGNTNLDNLGGGTIGSEGYLSNPNFLPFFR